jgi:hypothetical protein
MRRNLGEGAIGIDEREVSRQAAEVGVESQCV